MIVSIHQPQYLPWLGYFDKIDRSDIFVFLDNVQFKKNEWQNRNKIKTAKGWQWLTVPVFQKGRVKQKIKEVKIDNSKKWRRKHWNLIQTNYAKAPFFKDYCVFFEDIYKKKWEYLVDINIYIIRYLVKALGISNKKFVIASKYKLSEGRTERLIDICKQVGGDVYFSGKDGAKYLNLAKFKKEGIKVMFQDYKHPNYPQLYGSFEPYLSVIDLLFNCGPESLSVLKRGE